MIGKVIDTRIKVSQLTSFDHSGKRLTKRIVIHAFQTDFIDENRFIASIGFFQIFFQSSGRIDTETGEDKI